MKQLCLHTCYPFSCLLCEYEIKNMSERVYITIMLSFYILIGFHKVPKLLLVLLCQKLTEE